MLKSNAQKTRKTRKTVGINTIEQENKKPTVTLSNAALLAAGLGFCVIILMPLVIYTTLHVPDTSKQVITTPTSKKYDDFVLKEEGSEKLVKITPKEILPAEASRDSVTLVKSNISDKDTLRTIFIRSRMAYPITKARYMAVSIGIGVDDVISKLPDDKREEVIAALANKKMSCR